MNEYNSNNNEGSTDRGYLSDPEMYQQQVENEVIKKLFVLKRKY